MMKHSWDQYPYMKLENLDLLLPFPKPEPGTLANLSTSPLPPNPIDTLPSKPALPPPVKPAQAKSFLS